MTFEEVHTIGANDDYIVEAPRSALHEKHPEKAGYNKCSTCDCAEFGGMGDICSRCGHGFDEHW